MFSNLPSQSAEKTKIVSKVFYKRFIEYRTLFEVKGDRVIEAIDNTTYMPATVGIRPLPEGFDEKLAMQYAFDHPQLARLLDVVVDRDAHLYFNVSENFKCYTINGYLKHFVDSDVKLKYSLWLVMNKVTKLFRDLYSAGYGMESLPMEAIMLTVGEDGFLQDVKIRRNLLNRVPNLPASMQNLYKIAKFFYGDDDSEWKLKNSEKPFFNLLKNYTSKITLQELCDSEYIKTVRAKKEEEPKTEGSAEWDVLEKDDLNVSDVSSDENDFSDVEEEKAVEEEAKSTYSFGSEDLEAISSQSDSSSVTGSDIEVVDAEDEDTQSVTTAIEPEAVETAEVKVETENVAAVADELIDFSPASSDSEDSYQYCESENDSEFDAESVATAIEPEDDAMSTVTAVEPEEEVESTEAAVQTDDDAMSTVTAIEHEDEEVKPVETAAEPEYDSMSTVTAVEPEDDAKSVATAVEPEDIANVDEVEVEEEEEEELSSEDDSDYTYDDEDDSVSTDFDEADYYSDCYSENEAVEEIVEEVEEVEQPVNPIYQPVHRSASPEASLPEGTSTAEKAATPEPAQPEAVPVAAEPAQPEAVPVAAEPVPIEVDTTVNSAQEDVPAEASPIPTPVQNVPSIWLAETKVAETPVEKKIDDAHQRMLNYHEALYKSNPHCWLNTMIEHAENNRAGVDVDMVTEALMRLTTDKKEAERVEVSVATAVEAEDDDNCSVATAEEAHEDVVEDVEEAEEEVIETSFEEEEEVVKVAKPIVETTEAHIDEAINAVVEAYKTPVVEATEVEATEAVVKPTEAVVEPTEAVVEVTEAQVVVEAETPAAKEEVTYGSANIVTVKDFISLEDPQEGMNNFGYTVKNISSVRPIGKIETSYGTIITMSEYVTFFELKNFDQTIAINYVLPKQHAVDCIGFNGTIYSKYTDLPCYVADALATARCAIHEIYYKEHILTVDMGFIGATFAVRRDSVVQMTSAANGTFSFYPLQLSSWQKKIFDEPSYAVALKMLLMTPINPYKVTKIVIN